MTQFPPGGYTRLRLRTADVHAQQYLEEERKRNNAYHQEARDLFKHRVAQGDPSAIAEVERRKAVKRAGRMRLRQVRREAPIAGTAQNGEAETATEGESGIVDVAIIAETDDEEVDESGSEDEGGEHEVPDEVGVNMSLPTGRSGREINLREYVKKTKILRMRDDWEQAKRADKYVNSKTWQEGLARRGHVRQVSEANEAAELCQRGD